MCVKLRHICPTLLTGMASTIDREIRELHHPRVVPVIKLSRALNHAPIIINLDLGKKCNGLVIFVALGGPHNIYSTCNTISKIFNWKSYMYILSAVFVMF